MVVVVRYGDDVDFRKVRPKIKKRNNDAIAYCIVSRRSRDLTAETLCVRVTRLILHRRKMIADNTSWTMDRMNLLTFGMSAISLVGAVVQLAMLSGEGAVGVYWSYLGKVACCHFSLVSDDSR